MKKACAKESWIYASGYTLAYGECSPNFFRQEKKKKQRDEYAGFTLSLHAVFLSMYIIFITGFSKCQSPQNHFSRLFFVFSQAKAF